MTTMWRIAAHPILHDIHDDVVVGVVVDDEEDGLLLRLPFSLTYMNARVTSR